MTAATQSTVPTRKQPSRKKRHTTFFGVVGEILITLGVLLLLFVAWQLWWTDVLGERAYDTERATLAQEWDSGKQVPEHLKTVNPKYGKAFGLLYIPALKNAAWAVPLIEGTSRAELQRGIGHHVDTTEPGQLGNFALAGHRNTYAAPLGDIDQLEPGNKIIVETKFGWYTYALDKSVIINPWESWILDPVPGEPPGTKPTEALITIYSCHPKYSTAQRYVWFGHLVSETPKSDGPPPAVESAGGI